MAAPVSGPETVGMRMSASGMILVDAGLAAVQTSRERLVALECACSNQRLDDARHRSRVDRVPCLLPQLR